MRKITYVSVLAVGLSGCAHAVDLIDQKDGNVYSTKIQGKGLGNGDIAVTVAGEEFTGTWLVMGSGGSVGTVIGSSGGAVVTGTVYGAPTTSNGAANLHSASGKTIRCQFSYDSWSGNGLGACQSNSGATYDLRIH